MSGTFNKESKYEKIINIICEYKGISKGEIFKVLKDRECKYLLFLLLKKYNCTDIERLSRDLYINNKKTINYNIKKAEERFWINKEFRERFFEAEEIIKKA